ncbi:hypothetical protein LC55x_1787 [Lysobacter capsici]|nr:hypothetical protein LC55x_1787 [Lysobacter capsici]
MDRHRNRPVHGRLEREFAMKSWTLIGAPVAFTSPPAPAELSCQYGFDRCERCLQTAA